MIRTTVSTQEIINCKTDREKFNFAVAWGRIGQQKITVYAYMRKAGIVSTYSKQELSHVGSLNGTKNVSDLYRDELDEELGLPSCFVSNTKS